MEPSYAQLIAMFVAWREDIDSEPFAYESTWENAVPVVDIPQQARGPRVTSCE